MKSVKVNFLIFIVFPALYSAEENSSQHNQKSAILQSLQENNYSMELQALTLKLQRIIKVKNCFTIITDQFHKEIFKKSFFTNFHSDDPLSYFVINVRNSEDMLNPNHQTVRILKEVKRNNCDLILIFILNGIQAKRFLIFVDEYRILNTRSKFILLYDHRILDVDMLYIWRRILSVVFIRIIESKDNSGIQNKIGFELVTVPFPNILKGTFVSKKLAVWLNGKLVQGSDLFYDKASNLEGLELKTVVFEHTPMVSRQYNSDVMFIGLEVEIVKSFCKVMNFTVNFYQSNDVESEKWGRKLLNGSYTGLMGEMVNRQADIAIADLYYNLYHLKLMDLSIPHSSECLTFLTPESTTDNSWKTFILPLSANMWTGVFLSLISVGTVFYSVSCIRRAVMYNETSRYPSKYLGRGQDIVLDNKSIERGDIFDTFSNCLLLTYSMLLQVALPRMPFTWPLRILTGWYWTYCIQLAVIYRASLTAILANPSPRITIDTLKDLADSSLIVGAWGEQNKEFFNMALDESAQKIAAKLEQIDDPNLVVSRIASGKYAFYDNEYFLRYLRLKRVNNFEGVGKEVLHVMKECALNMPISIGLEKNSPLKPNVDKYIRRLIEGGLIDKWLKDSTKDLTADEDMPQEALMDLKKFWSSLVVLIFGYLIGCITLIVECLHFKYVVKKHPLYDTYNPRAYYQFLKKHKN